MTNGLTRLVGRVRRNLSVATGDRTGEARGVVEEERGHKPDERELDAETEQVKAAHHDYGEQQR